MHVAWIAVVAVLLIFAVLGALNTIADGFAPEEKDDGADKKAKFIERAAERTKNETDSKEFKPKDDLTDENLPNSKREKLDKAEEDHRDVDDYPRVNLSEFRTVDISST